MIEKIMNKEIIKKLQDKIGIEDISDKELLKKYKNTFLLFSIELDVAIKKLKKEMLSIYPLFDDTDRCIKKFNDSIRKYIIKWPVFI